MLYEKFDSHALNFHQIVIWGIHTLKNYIIGCSIKILHSSSLNHIWKHCSKLREICIPKYGVVQFSFCWLQSSCFEFDYTTGAICLLIVIYDIV